MVRQVGKDAFMEMLDDAMPLSRFFFENLLKTHNVGTPEGKIALKKAAMPLIESTLGDDQKQMLLEELAKHTDADEEDWARRQQIAELKNKERARKASAHP